MDRCTSASTTDSTIEQDRYDSDHKPLVLGLSFPTPAAVASDVPAGPPGHCLPKMHWDGSKRDPLYNIIIIIRMIAFPSSLILAQPLLKVGIWSAPGSLLQLLQS